MQNINDRMAESIANFQKTGGPAFPTEWSLPSGSMSCPGMTLRDWFAGQALGFLSTLATDRSDEKIIAAQAYIIADAMLAEREKGGAA